MRGGKIKCGLNSLPSGHELSGSQEGTAHLSRAKVSPPEQHRQRGQEITSTPSHCLLPEGCPGCLPGKKLVPCILLSPSPVERLRGMGCSLLHYQGCTSSTPHLLSSLPKELGYPPQNSLDSDLFMTSAPGHLQDQKGLWSAPGEMVSIVQMQCLPCKEASSGFQESDFTSS